MKIRLSRVLLLVVTAFILAGCHKLEAETIIEPNGSGELRMEIGFSAEERANMEEQNSNSQDFCNTSQTPSNVSVIEEQRGDETWCINITQFNDLDELRALYEQQSGIKVNRLEIGNGRFYFDVDLDTSSEGSSFSALTEITWSVILPGAPISHNADEVNGNRLTWIPTPKSGIVNLRAESESPRGPIFPSCGTVVVGLGAGLIYLRKKDP